MFCMLHLHFIIVLQDNWNICHSQDVNSALHVNMETFCQNLKTLLKKPEEYLR